MRVNRALSVLLLLALLGPGTDALARPRPEPKHAAPADSSSVRGRQPSRSGLQSIQLSRSERVRSLLQEAGFAPVPGARTAVPTAPPPRSTKRERQSVEGETSAGTERGDTALNTPDAAETGVEVFVPGPVTEAVAHVCGNVTVCGVWWPAALGDRDAYKACMLHRPTGADGLEFGTSPEEYCSALYNGDCDTAAPQSDLSELCSLVPGVAAQWTPDYTFSRMTTAGDCGLYKTVAIEEKRVLGLRLEPPSEPDPPARAASAPQLRICTGRLYLRIAH